MIFNETNLSRVQHFGNFRGIISKNRRKLSCPRKTNFNLTSATYFRFLVKRGGGGGRSSLSHSAELREGRRCEGCALARTGVTAGLRRVGAPSSVELWFPRDIPCSERVSGDDLHVHYWVSSKVKSMANDKTDGNSRLLCMLHALHASLNCVSIPAKSL